MENTEQKLVYSIDLIIEKILHDDKQYDLSKIVKAYEVAAKAHQGQFRSSGEPYIIHPLAVAYILLQFGMDTDTICAALLHDVVEDTDTTLKELKDQFGQDVAMLVDGVTKIDKIALFNAEEQQAENVHRIVLAMWKDIRVIIIKLCDRLHNMRTLEFRPEHKQRKAATETMNIFVPIARKLGMRTLRDELEELSLKYLDPYAYSEILSALNESNINREGFIESIKQKIKERFNEVKFSCEPHLEGRVKSIYGIYKKAYSQGKTLEQIYDTYAVRVIVNTMIECYYALGIIHDMFTPVPNRFKDYIGTPKSNMYQSLHTTVLGKEGIPFEVQIRTWDMHHLAEDGIAAHWKYKEGIQGKDILENRLAWIRSLLETQKDTNDVEDIVRTLKNDCASEEILALSPKGRICQLPVNSTVIDFAYAIHSKVGEKMNGAKVDGKLVSLDYKLRTGEIVEIITSNNPNHGPSRAWLNICVTSNAKSKIRSWLKREFRDDNIQHGKTELEKEFKKYSINVPEKDLTEFLHDDMSRHNCASIEDLYAAIGYGGITLPHMMPRLRDRYIKIYQGQPIEANPAAPPQSTEGEIVLDGNDNVSAKYSKCCNPIPGDDVVGFITRGHGISVHKRDCINYTSAVKNNNQLDRWYNVQWSDKSMSSENRYFEVTLDIIAPGSYILLPSVTQALADMHIHIGTVRTKILKNGNQSLTLTISTAGTSQLNKIITHLRKLPNVISVDRTVNP